ncbi:MFS transporter [Paracidovorax valerianellae]|uniref:Major Facilitator Superfamily protein n=1 Tax=Paracidovorax valerianellae TaxID=187868 RepID=A0A1G6XQ45_9BURK|nr:MFS transporter [Paracidovorax valerianellae]MDA8443506.1 MFS transporter [Paracidovorax valerianellae]SDD79555.1 Major Facilitator Superfamily protein [Paracidovorax valerianellae]
MATVHTVPGALSAPHAATAGVSLTALAGMAFFMADVRDGLGPFLATYLQTQRIDQTMIGIVLSAGGLAAMAATPLAGALADRTRAKRALVAVCALIVLGASAAAFLTRSPGVLVLSQVLTGAAGAVLAAALAAITLGLARSQGLRHQTGRNEAYSHAGNIVSALGAAALAHWMGAPWMLVVMTAMAVGALACLRAIRPGDIDHVAARGGEAASTPPVSTSVNANATAAVAPEGWRAFLGHRALWCFGLACALFHLGNAAMLPLLNQRLAATVPGSSPLLWTGIAIVVAQLTMVPVALWVSRSRRWDLEVFVYAAILALPIRGVIAWAIPDAWANIPVQVLDGLAAGALGVATPLMVERYVRGSGRYNTALGLVMTLQGVGAAISPAVANSIVGTQGHFGLAFAVLAGCAVLALPVFWLAQRAASTRPIPAAAARPAAA